MNETELLFTGILNCDRLSLYQSKDLRLKKAQSGLIASALKRRMRGEPIQYILGKTEFLGFEFRVGPGVLIPRPETEILVEVAIKIVSGVRCQVSGVNILDLGTGSGCIAVSLAKFLPQAEIYATDISADALEIARINAKLNKLESRIKFIQSDLFATYDLRLTTYDLIMSNPPYIAALEIETLQPEVQYEPRIALDGGRDGLDFYRRIIKEAPPYLKDSGFLIMEMGFGQCSRIKNIFQKSGKFEIIEVVKDYNEIDRVIVAEFKATRNQSTETRKNIFL